MVTTRLVCGLFGFLGKSRDTAAGEQLVGDAQRALRHRGPDDAGSFVDREEDHVCLLAHTRLSILDLSTGGHQPMFSRDRRYVTVFNGEIYNFRELRAELAADGVVFSSESDTEVILEAFAAWGTDAFARLRGMFAIALWDRRLRKLTLVRDRLGVKPLYIANTVGGGLAFASEVRALLASGLVPRTLSSEALSSFLEFGSVAEPDTMLDGVGMLAVGTFLERSATATRQDTYYELPVERAILDTRENIIERTRALLDQSIALRLEADVPVGVFLSGGVDSAAVAILAARAAAKPVRSFTVTFDRGDDEGARARALAERLGLVHEEAHLESRAVARDIDAAVAALDQPSADGVNTYFVSRAARQSGLKVALSGIGGDELFAGYSTFRQFRRLRAFSKRAWLPSIARRSIAPATALSGLPNSLRRAVELVTSNGDAGSFYRLLRVFFTPGQVRRLLPTTTNIRPGLDGALVARVEKALRELSVDDTNAFGLLEVAHYLRNTLLRDTDVMSMANGLEVREPLLDHQLVEFVLRVPEAVKLAGQGNKPLLTAAVPEIPRVASVSSKRGFTLPFEHWMRGPLRTWTEERLLSGPLVLNRNEVTRLWKAFLGGSSETSWSRVWAIAVLSDWCARHRIDADIRSGARGRNASAFSAPSMKA